MNKSNVGTISGFLSLLPVIGSVIFFYTERGPNADGYLIIDISSVLSIIGIILAVLSLWMSKGRISKLVIGLVGLIANVVVLVFALLLLLAMGMGEA